jgi:hypothetical protein
MEQTKINLLIDKYSCNDHKDARLLIDNPVVSSLLDEVIDLKKKNSTLQYTIDEIIDQWTNDPEVINDTLDAICGPE